MISLSSLLFQTCICISVNLSEGTRCSLRGAHPPKSSPTHFSSHRHELTPLQTAACTANNASSNCFIHSSAKSLVVLTGAWSLQKARSWVKCWWDRLEKYGTDNCEKMNSASRAAKKWQDQAVQPALGRYELKVTAGMGSPQLALVRPYLKLHPNYTALSTLSQVCRTMCTNQKGNFVQSVFILFWGKGWIQCNHLRLGNWEHIPAK